MFAADDMTLARPTLSQLLELLASKANDQDKERLRELAQKFELPSVALNAPTARWSWEVSATVGTAAGAPSPPVRFELPSAQIIVGWYAAVSFTPYVAAGPVPRLDDFQASITYQDESQRNVQLTDVFTADTTLSPSSFVCLGSLHILAPRLVMLPLVQPKPIVQVQFRARDPGGLGAAGSAICSLTALVY